MTQVDIHAPGVEVKKSACYFCHANCGVLAYVKDGDVIKIEGDPNYTNLGGLCCRGNIALKHVNHPARINHCLRRAGEKGENKWEQIPWDQGIREVAERLNQIKAESGAEAVATAGGTTRTDDYARRRFFNIFGSPNTFHNALLCWIPTFMVETCVSGWSPFETDLGQSRCVILWGMNPGASTLPGMHGYMDLQLNGLKIIVVDPRYSETAAKADLWLPLRPGSDTALALAMLHVIMHEGMMDFNFVTTWCDGFDELFDHMEKYTPEWAEPITWLPAAKIREAAKMYAMNRPSNIQWGCTWDQLGPDSVSGSHARALMRAVTGNLDCPGGDLMPGPSMTFLTDEELECNELLPEEQKAKQIGSKFFKLTSWPGYSKVAECCNETWGKAPTTEWMCEAHGPSVFRAILTGDPYRVRALIVNATNPVSCYGDSKMTLRALKECEFLVTVDYWMTTAAFYSDYIFPPAGALERPIMHTNYGATDSIQCSQRAIQPKFDRHDDYTFWKELGLACGQDPELWPWETEEDVYFDVIKPLGYPINSYDEFVETYRMFFPPQQFKKYEKKGFCTPTRKVELNSTILRELGYPGMPEYHGCAESPDTTPELLDEYPIVLTTGGQFMPYHHSEQFNMPTLRYLYPDPYFTIHPDLAAQYGIEYGDWTWIETRRGRIRMRANVEKAMDPRAIWAPRGWWFPERDPMEDPEAPFGCLQSNVNVLTSVDNEHCCPIGGSWANRGLLCKIYKCTAADLQMKADTRFSIPGSSAIKSNDLAEAIQVLPSDQPLAFDPIPWVEPTTDREVPECLKWVWQRDIIIQPVTGWEWDEESGWVINPEGKENKPGKYYDMWTGWTLDKDQELLLDEASGQYYTFDRLPVTIIQGIKCYPGMSQVDLKNAGIDIKVPAGFRWNKEGGYIDKRGPKFKDRIYDVESGWFLGIYTGSKYDPKEGYKLDEENDVLYDKETGKYFDKDNYSEITLIQGIKCYPGKSQVDLKNEGIDIKVPAGFRWNKEGGYVDKRAPKFKGKIYDTESGWFIGIEDGAKYDVKEAYKLDEKHDLLYDAETDKYFDKETYDEVGLIAGVKCYPGKPQCPYQLPFGAVLMWNRDLGYCTAPGKKGEGKIYDPDTGWLVGIEDGVWYDIKKGYALDPDTDTLIDMKTGDRYEKDTYIKLIQGVKVYPKKDCPYDVPEGLEYDKALGYCTVPGEFGVGKIYNPDTGWLVDIADGSLYDLKTGYWYNEDDNLLYDIVNDITYDKDTNEKVENAILGHRVYPGKSQVDLKNEGIDIKVPAGFRWNKEGGYIDKRGPKFKGKMYDVKSGWFVGIEDGKFYDAKNGYQYDAATGELVDLETGNRFDLEGNPVAVAAE